MNKKRILQIIILILAIGGISLYFLSQGGAQPEEAGEKSGFSFSDLFPFGDSSTSDSPTPITNNPVAEFNQSTNISKDKLSKVWNQPVSGATFIESGTSTKIRFVEKATGNIYDVDLSLNTPPERITNTTITKIERVFWNESGDIFIGQKDLGGLIDTFSVSLISEKMSSGTTTATESNFKETEIEAFPSGIIDIAVSPKKNSLFYTKEVEGGMFGYISDFENTKTNLVWKSALSQWTPEWTEEGFINLTTKPSVASEGYSFNLSTGSGDFNKTLGPIIGLSVKNSPDGKHQIYSDYSSKKLNTFIKSDDGFEKNMRPKVLPEKCSWSNTNQSVVYCAANSNQDFNIDRWYQGLETSVDSMWIYNVQTGASNQVSNLKEGGVDLDVVELKTSPQNTWLMFKNRTDNTLWILPIDPDGDVLYRS